MNNNLKNKIISLLSKGTRLDGRKLDEYRPVQIFEGENKNSSGSARVKIGNTEVIAGVTMEIMKPYPDSADRGSLMVNVELTPMSNPAFESGPPSIDSIELARITDRAIRESKMIDLKKLCITEGEKAWMVVIDVCTLNDEGNVFDAIAIAAVAAVLDTKLPTFDGESVDYKNLTDQGLPVSQVPIELTVFKYGEHLVVDPTIDEMRVYDSRLTIAVLEDGNFCALQKGGEIGFTTEDLGKMLDLVTEKSKDIRKLI